MFFCFRREIIGAVLRGLPPRSVLALATRTEPPVAIARLRAQRKLVEIRARDLAMTPAEAATCARAFKPKVLYPYHYRGQDPHELATALQGTGVEVRLRDWYPVADAGR